MKKLLSLILAGLLSVIVVEAVAISCQNTPIQIETPDNPPTETIIVLHGDLILSTGPNSIEACHSKNSVQICFHQNFGYVNITLMSETGSVVYNNTVNTAVQHTFYIPISGTSSGNYTLVLDNANGYAEGDFAR